MAEFVNYAHRGASSYAPENTLSAFCMGLQMGANGIETDVQRTRDGVLVLFHDDSITRITGREGAISDYTYQELLSMDMGAHKGDLYRGEKIVTFEEFLRHFGNRNLTLAIEIKQLGIEKDIFDMLQRMPHIAHIVITSFKWDALVAYRVCDPQAYIGYLTKECASDALFEKLAAQHIQQICPRATLLTAEDMAAYRQHGLSVRAWGVADEALMHKMLALQVDGMTVNFPDLLTKALA